MLRLLLIAAVILICGPDGTAEARCRARKCQTVTASSSVSASHQSMEVTRTVTHATVQARAERLAKLDPGNCMHDGHHAAIGKINAWEGFGYGPSPADATRRCCMWGLRKPMYIGTAPGPRGGWYAVVIYH